jgi:F420-dependent oxidoreductase-like protein
MKLFGLQIPSFTYPGIPNDRLFSKVVEIARAGEESGFDSVFLMDHLYQISGVGPRTEPMLEGYTALAGIAAHTTRVRLGTLVTGVTYRNPALLAKIVTTLDIVSSGRAILGIGAAWNDEEHRGYGYEFPPVGERLSRLEEAVQICRLMFREEAPSFSGRFYRIEQVLNFPRPVQRGGPPIMIGGGGEQRTLKFVAEYADMCNLFGDIPTVKHKLEVLERHCAAIGRDAGTIVKTRLGTAIAAPTQAEAERKLKAVEGRMDPARRAALVWGGPERLAEQAQGYLEAGLDGLIFNFYDAQELEPVRVLGKALSGLGAVAAH